jgi:uncharacterized protein
MKKGIVALLLLAAIPFFVCNIVLAYTSPGKPTGFVNDFANVLSQEDKTELENTLINFKNESGDEIVVVTVPSLGDETIDTYAVKLFEEWQIGQKAKDNGLLLLAAMNDRKVRIEVGYGLEGDITDALSSQIIRNTITPAFKNGNYAQGIKAAVGTIIETLNGDVDTSQLPQSNDSGGGANWFFFAVFIPIWLASILGRTKSWWLGGVLGAIVGIVLGFFFGFMYTGIIATPVLVIIGLIFDYVVSKTYASRVSNGLRPPWWIGGGRGGGGFGGGGFGGFGGGRSGGGGASGGW